MRSIAVGAMLFYMKIKKFATSDKICRIEINIYAANYKMNEILSEDICRCENDGNKILIFPFIR